MDRREFVFLAGSIPLSLALGGRAIAATPRSLALVTADLESHVVVLDPLDARVVGRIDTSHGPRSIEAARTTAVVAHTNHGLVSILDAGSSRVRFELRGFDRPRYTAVHPRRPIAYVTDSANEEVVVIDLARGDVVSRTPLPGPARHVSVSSDGSTLWTSLGSKAERVAVVTLDDVRRPKLTHALAPPFLAHDVVFAPDGRHVWVTSGAGRRIAIYRADTREVVRIIAADRAPQHIAFAGREAFVTSGDDGTLRVHRLNGDLVREAVVPSGSYNVSIGAGRAVTPSLSRGTVAVADELGRVLAVRKIARAAHDACVVSSV